MATLSIGGISAVGYGQFRGLCRDESLNVRSYAVEWEKKQVQARDERVTWLWMPVFV
jgi:hypothetical protein